MYHHMSEQNMEPIHLAKEPESSHYMTWGADNNYDVKRVKDYGINGYTGNYYGEILKTNGK